MRLLERYIAKTVLSAIAFVTLMLAGLQIFILFVNQLPDLGKADYDIGAAIYFVLCEMPYEVYLFFPMASLLGCLIGLGVLANHHELVVMRASGMSIGQVTLAILKVAAVMICFVTLCGEVMLPRMVHLARDQKIQALSGGQSLRTARGVWLRNHNDFISVATVVSGHHLENVYQFHFDASHALQFARHMDSIDYQHGEWRAVGVLETALYPTHSQVKNRKTMRWDVPLQPNILTVSMRDPDEMTLVELYRYLHVQQVNHQMAQNYQLVYWQRLVQPLTTVVMMILAIPFIFGPLRSSTMGSKLLIGATVGFGFHILNRFLGSMSQVYQFSVIISALGPTCVFALLGLYFMQRAR